MTQQFETQGIIFLSARGRLPHPLGPDDLIRFRLHQRVARELYAADAKICQ